MKGEIRNVEQFGERFQVKMRDLFTRLVFFFLLISVIVK